MLNENFLLIGALLLFVAVLAGKAAYRLGAPALLLFLGVGVLFGYNDFVSFHSVDFAEFVGMVALCIILFGGGMDTTFSDIRPVMMPGVVMATLGVALTAAIVGLFIYFVAPMVGVSQDISLPFALLMAATMSSTDSASVFSILRTKKQGLMENLRPLLELESGSNDPMAYVLTVVLVSVVTGDNVTAGNVVGTFFVQMLVGAVLGYLFGRITVWIINKINIRSNQSLYSVLLLACAFFTFSFTTMLYGNGYLAVYIAGLVVGNMKIVHRNMLRIFFDSFTWLLQIVLFLLLGLIVNVHELLNSDVLIMGGLIGLFMILFARPVAVFLSLAPFRNFSVKARTYVSWVGLRGAVPIIFALYSVSHNVENSDFLFNVVFIVTIISLLIQGTTVSGMANWLNLSFKEKERTFKLIVPDHIRSEFSEIEVNNSMLRNGKTLKDIRLPGHTLVVMVYRSGNYFVPKGDTELHKGDKLLVVSDNNDELIRKVDELGIENILKMQ
ncbi:MAG: potassium/proton antiporter [Alistipes sp.]|nr:potassium/proton antiporter [Alistipes sp.]